MITISLRDYFAGVALRGIPKIYEGHPDDAEMAYRIADKMMAARTARLPPPPAQPELAAHELDMVARALLTEANDRERRQESFAVFHPFRELAERFKQAANQ